MRKPGMRIRHFFPRIRLSWKIFRIRPEIEMKTKIYSYFRMLGIKFDIINHHFMLEFVDSVQDENNFYKSIVTGRILIPAWRYLWIALYLSGEGLLRLREVLMAISNSTRRCSIFNHLQKKISLEHFRWTNTELNIKPKQLKLAFHIFIQMNYQFKCVCLFPLVPHLCT